MTADVNDGLDVTEHGRSVRFAVRVQPRSASNAVTGVHGGALKVRLHAPPVDGAANEALVEQLAAWLDVPRRAVRIVAGATSRAKVVEVNEISRARVLRFAAEHL